jgi:hypothetical protein
MFMQLWLVNLRGDLSEEQTAVFEWILEKRGVEVSIGINWHRIESNGEHFCKWL